MKKWLKRIGISFLSLLLLAIIIHVWTYLPVMTGFAAKIMCSGVFVSGRNAKDIERDELSSFPCFHIPHYTINYKDSSVTASFWGMASKTVVYRKSFGATLVNNGTVPVLPALRIHQEITDDHIYDSLPWPAGERILPVSHFIDTAKLSEVIGHVFYANGDTIPSSRAVVVLYNGQLIYEKYAKGFTSATQQAGWSMAKSITNAMCGLMVKEQKLSLLAPAPLPEWQQDNRKNITIANLMQLNSGLHWWGFEAAASNTTNMIFKEDDMAAYAIHQPLAHPPGSIFNYSDGSVNILQHIIRKLLGDSLYYSYPYEKLFYKIGMRHTVIEPDASGCYVGSSYVYATPRDWARFGLLYLQDGIWNGERVLPEGWIKFSTTQSNAVNKHKGGRYGAGWWVNQPDIHGGHNRLYTKVPQDCFYAQGFDGQYIWVIPSKKLVVVRLARDGFRQFDPNDFLGDILKTLP